MKKMFTTCFLLIIVIITFLKNKDASPFQINFLELIVLFFANRFLPPCGLSFYWLRPHGSFFKNSKITYVWRITKKAMWQKMGICIRVVYRAEENDSGRTRNNHHLNSKNGLSMWQQWLLSKYFDCCSLMCCCVSLEHPPQQISADKKWFQKIC